MKKRFVSALLAFGLGVTSFTNIGSVVHAANPLDYFDGCEYVYGDCNGDAKFDVLDLISLKNWLLNVSGTELVFWRNADMNFDGRLDVFDLCIMRDYLIESMNTYSRAKYSSKNEEYTMNFSIVTDYRKRSSITVEWYDPDGDKEKTDSFEVKNGNPFKTDGEWTDDKTYGNEDYKIVWNESSVKICFEDKNEAREVVLDYPDRTKKLQTLTEQIVEKSAPEVASIDIIAETYGEITQKVKVRKSGNVMSRDTVGRVGAAITVDVDNSIDEYTVVLHYDESELRWVPEKNLKVIEYNKSVQQFTTFTPVTDAVQDIENNTITFKGHPNCDYILIDTAKKSYGGSAYETTDITQYVSDWERMDDTGDIMKLADKEWAKANAVGGTFSVSTPEELASAVYYINAIQSISGSTSRSDFNIELKNDIDLEGYDWKPITLFKGDLNGNNYSIKNMNITGKGLENVGFIGESASSTICDITFENAVITSSRSILNIGVVAGSGTLTGLSEFKHVSVTGAFNINDKSEYVLYNGIVGGFCETKITDCTAHILINGEKVHEYPIKIEELVSLSLDSESMIVNRTSDEQISTYTAVILRNDKTAKHIDFTKSEQLNLHEIEEFALVSGDYKVFVQAYRNGGKRRISNIVEYTIE